MKHDPRRTIPILCCLLAGLLIVTGCDTAPQSTLETTSIIEPTSTLELSSIDPTTPVLSPTPEQTEEAVDQCVVCHTSKDLLILSAKPEEEVVTENEGAG